MEESQEGCAKGWEERKDFQKGAEVSVSETPLFRPIGSVPTSGAGAGFSEKRGHGTRANGSFPKEAGRLSEKSPAGHRRRTIGTTPPGSAGVPAMTSAISLPESDTPRERGRPARMLLLMVVAQFPSDIAPGHPAGGNRMGPAEAEPWRRCRSIRVEEMGEAVPGFVRAGRPRSRGASSHDIVTPRAQIRRSIRAPLVIEGGPSVFGPMGATGQPQGLPLRWGGTV